LDEVQAALKDVFQIMEAERLEFGFRTVNEILRYLRVDYAVAGSPDEWNWRLVFDDQILQKILPKLNGSKRRLEGLLAKLAWYCEEAIVPPKGAKVPERFQTNPVKPVDSAVFRKSYEKLCAMVDVVRRDQFVSFIQ
jgi:5-methylcytosine-specific restriction protein B